MMAIVSPWRYDFVGSFLRPEKLKQARAAFEAGSLDAAGLKAVEDDAIRHLVQQQKDAGYRILTDGEFRRATWHLDFMWGFQGIGHRPTETGLPFHGEQAMIDDTYLVDRLSYQGDHPFLAHFRFVDSLTDAQTVAKLTIPAPAQFLEQLVMPFAADNTRKYYDDFRDVADDLVKGYQAFIQDAYAAGCRNLQLDDCSWGMVVDQRATLFFGVDEPGLTGVMEQLLDVNNRAIAHAPADMTITTHVCRGNFHSTYATSGGYDRVAEFLFQREHVSAYFLEFDDERSGGFAPLAKVPEGKKVVLGLVTTKRPALEDKVMLKARIAEAAQYVPLDRLCLSPQCGFASCEVGNILTEADQWAKLKLVKEVAEEVWGSSSISYR